MSENQAEPQPDPEPEVTTSELETPTYEVIEKGNDQSGIETRDQDN